MPVTRPKKKCPICKSPILGRTDKKFCQPLCRSKYHKLLSKHTSKATVAIDKILHRNRSILQELMGKKLKKIKVPIIELESKSFNFNYITNYTINSEGKEYRYVYDFAYMTFSDNSVLIVKVSTRMKAY